MIVEEDRISNLPDEIIHRILSFIDMPSAVQTSALSRRWRYAWTSMTCLNFDSRLFNTKHRFSKFVKQALSRRNNHAQVSTVDITFTGPTFQLVVQDIVNYAYLYNVKQLTMAWSTREHHVLPRYLFSSHTLKHLTLSDQTHHNRNYSSLLKSTWDLPSLETLNLSNMRFISGDYSLNLFSKCVNLKELTLHGCQMHELERFDVCAPQLLNLTVTDSITFPKVFKVVAPKLKNLTASVNTCPITFKWVGPHVLPLTTNGFSSLEKVNLSLSKPIYQEERQGPQLLKLFQKLGSAEYLILDGGVIEGLLICVDELSHEPCPFNKLKCLKINMMSSLKQNYCITTVPVQVRNYLLENSRDATVVLDYPQKRSREQILNNTTSNKVAKLEAGRKQLETMPNKKRRLEEERRMQHQVSANQRAIIQMQYQGAQQQASIRKQDLIIAHQNAKLQMQDQDIAKQKAMFEALKVQHDKLMSHIVEHKMEELKELVESKIPDYEVIHSMCCDLNSVIDMMPESFRVAVKARVTSLYEGLKSLLLTRMDASKWEMIETELGFLMISERTNVAEPSPMSRWPSVEANNKDGIGARYNKYP